MKIKMYYVALGAVVFIIFKSDGCNWALKYFIKCDSIVCM